VTKSEPSPEGELLRGVHDQRTTYTLRVRNTGINDTTGVTLTDYLPAGLEFLGCGDEDNSEPLSYVEYPGAPRLGVPADVPTDCLVPNSVETVTDPPPNGSQTYPPGVYTKLTWNLGTVTGASPVTIKYVAGIPLRANTENWTTPNPISTPPITGEQGSNLNNNNGASSREGASESSLTNYAHAEGTYQGATSGPVESSATQTVSVEDLRMRKSVSPTIFNSSPGNDIATYTIVVDSSEYVTADNIVITDVVPDGLCPLQMGATCDTGGGAAPSHPVDTVTGSGNGPHTVVFDPLALPKNGTVSVTFDARMMTDFTDGRPTVAGDTFTNNVSLTGDTTPIPDTGETGTQTVSDTSSATQRTLGSSLQKTMKSRADSSGSCSANLGQYYAPPPVATFRKGDRICFKLRVDFPDDVRTRNAVVQDFLPPGTEYISGSYSATAANTAPIASFASGPPQTWTLGTADVGGLYVPEGGVFEVTLAARVLDPAPPPVPDVLGNLMKVNTENTPGQVESMRDRVDLEIAPPPNVQLEKGVYEVDDPASGPFPPNQDGKEVNDNSVATFRIDITNGPSDPAAEFGVRDIQAFDVLPAGVVCADISNYRFDRTTNPSGTLTPQTFIPTVPPTSLSDYVNCYNDGDPGDPNINPAYGTSSQSVIAWRMPTDSSGDRFVLSANPAQTLTLLYDMAIPNGLGVSTRLDNSAGVRSFTSATNDASAPTAANYPADNIDADVPADDQDAAAADDGSWVYLPDAVLAKTGTTSITEQNNNTATQATIGEEITYTISATVPAHTTVFSGLLSDTLPTGQQFVSATAGYSATGVAPATDPLPGGFAFDSGTGTLTFPATWTNSTADDQLFQVAIIARVTDIPGNSDGVSRTNTGRFDSLATSGGTPLPQLTATYTTSIREPRPVLSKSVPSGQRPPNTVVAGETIDYTLVASNTTGRPPSHRTSVVDCINGNLTFDSVIANNGGAVATVPGDGTNGCASGTTKLTWDAGTVGLGDTPTPPQAGPLTLTYRTTVVTAVPGGISIPNTANLTGNSLATATADNRTYTSSASTSVETSGSTVVKSAAPNPATIGETVRYTATLTLPAGTSFYNLSAVDTLPAGLDLNASNVSVTCVDSSAADCLVGSPGFTALTPDPGTRKIGWLFGDYLNTGKDRTLTLAFDTVVLDEPSNTRGTVLTNSITSRWDNVSGQPAPTNVNDSFQNPGNTGTGTLTIAEPNVQLAKAVDDTTPAPGQTFTYTIQVTNPGISAPNPVSTAYDIDVTDCIPADVEVQPGTISSSGVLGAPTGPCPGGVITWTDLGPVAKDASLSPPLTYDAKWVASPQLDPTARTNTADVPSYFSQPAASTERREYTNTPDATATVTPSFPRVDAVKTTPSGPSGDIAYINQPFTWTITLTNNGGSRAYDVDAVDVLPNNWTYVPGSAQVSVPGQPTGPIDPTVSPVTGPPLVQTLTWTNLGNLDADPTEHIVITFQATPTSAVTTSPGVGHSVAQTNTVTPDADDATGASGNASGPYSGGPATATAHIDSADLQLTKTHTPATWIAGQQGTWKVAVTNNGPNSSVGPFVVTDTLPTGVTYVSASGGSGGTEWSCTRSGTTVTCTNTNDGNPLASGASLPEVDVVVSVPNTVPQGTQFTNTATVAATTYDPVPANNTGTDQVTVAAQADVKITKTRPGVPPPPVVAGQPVTYTLVVDNNNGPSVSQPNITVTDTLPASMSNATASGTGWVCTVSGAGNREISCVRDQALAVGQVAPTITVTADLASGTTGNLVNTAVVATTTTDPVPGNNTSTKTDPIGPRADLVMTKAVDRQLTPGAEGSYLLTVENQGPSDAAPSVTITDTLPTGLTYTGFEDVTGMWGCDYVSGTRVLTCTLGGGTPTSLVDGDTAKVRIKVSIDDPDFVSPVTNRACVESPTADPVGGNNCSQITTDPTREVDLAMEKDLPASVVAGTQMDFTLKVRNNGPSNTIQPITVSDTLPAQFEYVIATGSDWNCDYQAGTRKLTCERTTGLVKNTDAPTITVTVRVTSDAGLATISNTATVAGRDHDPVPANNSSTDQVQVGVMTDLVLTKTTQSPTTVRAGQNATFTIGVRNTGPSSAVNVSVADTLPAGMTLVSASGAGWDCTALVCSRDSLAPGAGPDITVVARVSPSVPGASSLRNTATVSTSSPESDPDNNTDRSDITTVTEADLGITKTHAGGSTTAGEMVTFTMPVRNHGPSDAQPAVKVIDELPSGMTYVSSGVGWNCAAGEVRTGGQTVTCTLSSGSALAADANAPDLTLTALVGGDVPTGDLTNTATVESKTAEPSPNPNSNTATDTVKVVRSADLAIVKSHTGDGVVGEDLTFTLDIRNNGPSAAQSPTVTDTFPSGLQPKTAAGTGWNCTIGGQKVTCTHAENLAVGSSKAITVTARVESSAQPSVTNTAEVSSPTADPDPKNNTSADKVPVRSGRVPVPIEVDSRPSTFRPKPGDWNKIVTVKKPSKKKFTTEIKVRCKIQGQGGKGGPRYCKYKIRPDGTVMVKPTTCSANVQVTIIVVSKPKPKYRDDYKRTRWTKSWKVASGKSVPCTNANG